MASVVEDKMERAIYLTPFSSRSLDDVVGEQTLQEVSRAMARQAKDYHVELAFSIF